MAQRSILLQRHTEAAIVVLADTETHDGELARLVNPLSTADDFNEHGDEVMIIIDGAAVRWAAELSKSEPRELARTRPRSRVDPLNPEESLANKRRSHQGRTAMQDAATRG